MVSSQLRFAAGVCALAAGLLMGGAGGAVAAAAPDSAGSAANGDEGTNGSAQGSTTATNPVGAVTDTMRKTILGVTNTLGLARQPGQQLSTSAKNPKTVPGGTATKDANEDPGLVAELSNLVAALPNEGARVTNVVAPVPSAVAPATNTMAPVTNVVAPATDVVAAPPRLVAPVTNPVAPGADVIVAVQDMLTSAADAVVVPLTQLQSGLSSFFAIAGGQPVAHVLGDSAGLSAAADASRLPLVGPLAGIPGAPLAGNATEVGDFGGTAASTFGATTHLGRASSLPVMASSAPNGVNPAGVPSFLRKVYNEFLLPASLSALAAVALPGVAGLVILTAAGVRVGYRQAKAGFALQTAEIARFARPGPLGVVRPGPIGVVRSGSLVAVRPRALSAGCLLDKAA